MAIGPVFLSAVVSYSLAYDAKNVMDNDNLTYALEALIQISIALVGTVRKPSTEAVVLAKAWGIIPEKPKRLSKPQLRKGSRLCSTLYCEDDLE